MIRFPNYCTSGERNFALQTCKSIERFTELCPFTLVTQWQDMALSHAPVVMVKLKKNQCKCSHLNVFGLEILLQVMI